MTAFMEVTFVVGIVAAGGLIALFVATFPFKPRR